MIELEDEIVEREEAFTDDWYMVRKMDRTPTFAEAIHWADTHPNWIKVEDRLPDEYKDVLVFCPFGFIDNLYVAHVDGIDFYTSDGAWVRPTHWMPIVLPKED